MEPAGSRPLGALPPNLSLPFLGSLPSLLLSLLYSSTLPPFVLLPPGLSLLLIIFPPSFFLSYLAPML